MSDKIAIADEQVTAPAAVAPQDGALTLQARPTVVDAPRTGEILPPKPKRRRILLPIVLLAALGGGGYFGHHWFVEGRFIVSTDDAYVKADVSTLAAKVSGYVTSVPVVENAAVTKGQVLATIDDGDYRNAVDAATTRIATQDATVARIGKQVVAQHAAIDQTRAMLQSAKADATRAASTFERADSLVRSTYGTQQKLDDARADRDRTIAAVANADAAVIAAQAAMEVLQAQKIEAERVRAELRTTLDKANRDLSFTVVKAPFDGVVGNKAVQTGQFVQTGTRLLAMVPLQTAYVEANFKETQIARLKPGQKVVIKPDAYGDRDVVGTVESIAPASGAQFSMLPPENATGNFTKVVQRLPVRIAVPSEVAREGILRPGLSVVVEVKTRDESEPRPSIVSALGLERVVARISDVLHRATGNDQGSRRTSLGANDVAGVQATAAIHAARESETVQR